MHIIHNVDQCLMAVKRTIISHCLRERFHPEEFRLLGIEVMGFPEFKNASSIKTIKGGDIERLISMMDKQQFGGYPEGLFQKHKENQGKMCAF